ncbi:hypothetical protein [Glycomyces arizonensis]|uniref:hypothetical protein n=1 Tax=Glycomyces arizonensis TaxID=256035 RepID=UPI0004109CA1|nr:hypothetical protein [Glycomyces arizonensis]
MSGSPTTRLRLVGMLFWLAGGAVITFGWMGMAEVACVDCQLPYVLSGGAAGLGLIIVGSTLVLAAAVLDAGERTAQRAAELFKAAAEEAEAAVGEAERERAEAVQDPK